MRLKKKYEWVYYTYVGWDKALHLFRRKSSENEKLTKYRGYLKLANRWQTSWYHGDAGLTKIPTEDARALFPYVKI